MVLDKSEQFYFYFDAGDSNVPPTSYNVEGLVPSNESEAEHFKKLHSDEVERRRNLQKDLLIERDRNKQLHLQLQQSRQEISKLNETNGSLKSRFANVVHSKNEQGYGTRKTIPVKNENAFLIKIP